MSIFKFETESKNKIDCGTVLALAMSFPYESIPYGYFQQSKEICGMLYDFNDNILLNDRKFYASKNQAYIYNNALRRYNNLKNLLQDKLFSDENFYITAMSTFLSQPKNCASIIKNLVESFAHDKGNITDATSWFSHDDLSGNLLFSPPDSYDSTTPLLILANKYDAQFNIARQSVIKSGITNIVYLTLGLDKLYSNASRFEALEYQQLFENPSQKAFMEATSSVDKNFNNHYYFVQNYFKRYWSIDLQLGKVYSLKSSDFIRKTNTSERSIQAMKLTSTGSGSKKSQTNTSNDSLRSQPDSATIGDQNRLTRTCSTEINLSSEEQRYEENLKTIEELRNIVDRHEQHIRFLTDSINAITEILACDTYANNFAEARRRNVRDLNRFRLSFDSNRENNEDEPPAKKSSHHPS